MCILLPQTYRSLSIPSDKVKNELLQILDLFILEFPHLLFIYIVGLELFKNGFVNFSLILN